MSLQLSRDDREHLDADRRGGLPIQPEPSNLARARAQIRAAIDAPDDTASLAAATTALALMELEKLEREDADQACHCGHHSF